MALWAQLASVIELVAGVALTGVGAGLSVLVAQAEVERQRGLLRGALLLGFGVALPAALAVALLARPYALAALAGWVAIAAGMVNAYWLGQEQRGRMLVLAGATSAASVAVAAAAPGATTLEWLTAAQAAPAVVLLLVGRAPRVELAEDYQALRRYLLPGLAIGVLSPGSLLVARALVADALSWHEAGELQALWRVGDWVAGLAGGVLSLLYLPRFARAHREGRLAPVARQALIAVVLPAGLALAALFFVQGPLLAALYDASFAVSGTAAALVFAGTLVRIAAWVPLFALYAVRRTRAIAFGELLSLPLFAGLVGLTGARLTLELAGALWLASFAAYCAFNFWAMRRP